jgi:nonsense-mediated mRNA decay protein 3
MVWNPAAMCANCIRTRTDITEAQILKSTLRWLYVVNILGHSLLRILLQGIPKSVPMQHCRNCGRYLNPPKAWTTCQPESKELMQICLKRIKGLNKVKLIDASLF